MSFRKNLEYLRKGRKLSQEDLGYKLGVSRQSVSKWESGAAYPETDKMLAMCKLFDCTLDELMNQNMQEEKAEEARRYTFNDLVKEATSIIDRSIRMITSMNFKSIVRFLFEIGILLVIIMLVRIPFNHIFSLGADIFRNFSANISGVFLAYWRFLVDLVYMIVAVVLFVYIYKVRFLDKFDDSESEEEEEVVFVEMKEEVNGKEVKSKVKEIKRIEVRKYDFGLFSLLGKMFLFVVKAFVIFGSFFVIFILLSSVAGLVVVSSWLLQGIVYISALVFLCSLIIFCMMVIKVIYNFVLNRRSNWKKIFYVLLASLLGFGISAGIGLLELKELSFVDSFETNIPLSRKVEEFKMKDDLIVSAVRTIEYVEDGGMGDNVRVEAEYYNEFSDPQIQEFGGEDGLNNRIFVGNDRKKIPLKKTYSMLLNDLRRKEIHAKPSYMFEIRVKVYATQENIDKMKKNIFEQSPSIYDDASGVDVPVVVEDVQESSSE